MLIHHSSQIPLPGVLKYLSQFQLNPPAKYGIFNQAIMKRNPIPAATAPGRNHFPPLNPLEQETIQLFVQLARILGHPCKIYNVLSVGAPVIYIGPETSHVTEILEGLQPRHPSIGVRHGAVEVLTSQIKQLRAETMGHDRQPHEEAAKCYSQATLLPQLVAILENKSNLTAD